MLFEISFSGIKKITLKEKYVFFSTLTSNHRKPKFTQ